jgi:uncharacterized metal-binding protein
MPDGKNHDLINILVLALILSGIFYFGIWKENELLLRHLNIYVVSMFSGFYLFATFFLSPDLDIESTPYKRWSFLRFLWWPYKVMFKHRGLSHHIIIGPLSIVLNLAIIVAVLLLLAGVDLQNLPLNFVEAAVTGMVLSIEIHILSDRLVSKMKAIF